uniref:Peptidase_S9 domain-containing protein n=1 Tax=Caenorhabditis tropicalis TaxID=1561998 RepID=A0A1I7UIQ3_9PELO
MSNSKDDQKKKRDEEKSVKNKNSISAKRSPTRVLPERDLDKTQELSSPDFKIDREKSTRNAIILSGYSSRRVRYRNHWMCLRALSRRPTPRFTLLYSHPNGSDLSDHLIGVPSLIDIARFYRCEVYSYDYSGYGISGGIASEKNVYADIRAVYEYITQEKRIDPKRVVLLGFSIGSAATIELLRHEKDRKPAGVILQAPPTSILRVIGTMIGRRDHLEKRTCCMDRFVTIDKIHEIEIPILIIHGKEDHTVPIEHGELLCQRAVHKVTPEWVPEASHDNIENCRVVWRRIRKFVRQELKLK